MRAIERDPTKRYETARELGRQLNRFLVESQLMVGLAEVPEVMNELFPEGQACARQLISVAEQMDEISDGSSTFAVVDTEADESGSAEISVVDDSPNPLAKAVVAPSLWRWPRPTLAIAQVLAIGLLLVGASALVGWRLHGASGTADNGGAAKASAAAAPASAPTPASAPLPPMTRLAPTVRVSGPSPGITLASPAVDTAALPPGYAVEALPIGADESGAVLLRLQIVPRANQPAPAPIRSRRPMASPVTLWPSPRPANGATSLREEARAEKIAQKGG
jgi:hypothetical protein